MADDRHNRIRQRAHEIWEQEGRPDGSHERHWRQAESEVTAADAKAAQKPATARKPAASARTAEPAAAAKPATEKATAAPKPTAKPRAAARSAVAAKKG